MTGAGRDCVVFPDLGAEGLRRGFDQQILQVLPGVQVVAAVNGAPGACAHHAGQVRSVVSARGFNWAVLAALRCAVESGAGRVVRMDTAEHPLEHLPRMLDLLDRADVVVADLTFDETTMRPGSADDYHNHVVMPALHAAATGGAVALSGACGYMSFTGGALELLLPAVERAFVATSEDPGFGGQPAMWGVDAALVTVASRRGMSVHVDHLPAERMRDRPTSACAAQLLDTVRLLGALDRTS